MKNLLKIAVLGFMMLPFTACFRKKEGISNLQEWLDKHYPNRFQVLYTGADDAIRHLSFKVKKSVVAERENPLVQAQIKWDKREKTLGLTTAMVDTAFTQAKTNYHDAVALSSLLKSHGFGKMAVGINNWTAVVRLMGETSPESREKLLARLETAFQAWDKSSNYDKEILLVDANSQAALPGEVLPLDYFLEGNGQYRKQATYLLQLASNETAPQEDPAEAWQFNTENDQFSQAHNAARAALEDWAKKHYPKPYYLMEVTEYESIGQHPLTYRFAFPFTQDDPQEKSSNSHYMEPDGYFYVDFDLENKTSRSIKMTNDQ